MTDERMKWRELRTLLIICEKQPGRLVNAETNEPLTVEGLLSEYEKEVEGAREMWNAVKKNVDRYPLKQTKRHSAN